MSDAAAPIGLKRTLRLRHLYTLGVGTIVGVAWLMVLSSVLATAGPVGASIGFVVGAIAMIPIGLCYAELTGVLPHAGGEIVYAYHLFGTGWAYVIGVAHGTLQSCRTWRPILCSLRPACSSQSESGAATRPIFSRSSHHLTGHSATAESSQPWP